MSVVRSALYVRSFLRTKVAARNLKEARTEKKKKKNYEEEDTRWKKKKRGRQTKKKKIDSWKDFMPIE